jgi:hypothetical protein
MKPYAGLLLLMGLLATEYVFCFLPIHLALRRRIAAVHLIGATGSRVIWNGFVASCAIPAGLLVPSYLVFNPYYAPGGVAFGGNIAAVFGRLLLLVLLLQVAMVIGTVRLISLVQKDHPSAFGGDRMKARAMVAPVVFFLCVVLVLVFLHAIVGLR